MLGLIIILYSLIKMSENRVKLYNYFIYYIFLIVKLNVFNSIIMKKILKIISTLIKELLFILFLRLTHLLTFFLLALR